MDLGLPGRSGAELTRSLLDADPGVRIVLYTGAADEGELLEGLDAGAAGFALKSGDPVLSPGEREILELLCQGLSGEEAARRLVLSAETVRTHVRNAMSKLGAASGSTRWLPRSSAAKSRPRRRWTPVRSAYVRSGRLSPLR